MYMYGSLPTFNYRYWIESGCLAGWMPLCKSESTHQQYTVFSLKSVSISLANHLQSLNLGLLIWPDVRIQRRAFIRPGDSDPRSVTLAQWQFRCSSGAVQAQSRSSTVECPDTALCFPCRFQVPFFFSFLFWWKIQCIHTLHVPFPYLALITCIQS